VFDLLFILGVKFCILYWCWIIWCILALMALDSAKIGGVVGEIVGILLGTDLGSQSAGPRYSKMNLE